VKNKPLRQRVHSGYLHCVTSCISEDFVYWRSTGRFLGSQLGADGRGRSIL